MDRLDTYRLFIRVAELGGFRVAANAHQITAGSASKRIAALEAQLGVNLFHRTTRAVTLTDDGMILLERIRPLLAEFTTVEDSVSAKSLAPAGRLRLSAPMDWGRMVLSKPVAKFLTQWPSIEMQFSLTDRMVDLVHEGFDMAIRIGDLENSTLIARKLGAINMVLCAAPAFIEQYGSPSHPDELADLPCLIDTNKPSPAVWKFFRGAEQAKVRVPARLELNGAATATQMACQNVGLAYTTDFTCQAALQSGQLVRLLPDWQTETRGIWALYPSSRHLTRRVRLFLDFLIQEL